jgi:hypothetical protein
VSDGIKKAADGLVVAPIFICTKDQLPFNNGLEDKGKGI